MRQPLALMAAPALCLKMRCAQLRRRSLPCPRTKAALPTPKHVLLVRLREAIENATKGREQWVNGMVDQALILCEARDHFQANDSAFGAWLGENEVDAWGRDDRAAMINLAKRAKDRNDLVFIFDKFADDRWKPDTIWRCVKEKWEKFDRQFRLSDGPTGAISDQTAPKTTILPAISQTTLAIPH